MHCEHSLSTHQNPSRFSFLNFHYQKVKPTFTSKSHMRRFFFDHEFPEDFESCLPLENSTFQLCIHFPLAIVLIVLDSTFAQNKTFFNFSASTFFLDNLHKHSKETNSGNKIKLIRLTITINQHHQIRQMICTFLGLLYCKQIKFKENFQNK